MAQSKPIHYTRQSDSQLLANIVSERSANLLVDHYDGNLKEIIMRADYEELKGLKGITPIQARKLQALSELVNRAYNTSNIEDIQINNPLDIFEVVKDMQYLQVEQFVCLYLNTKNKIIKRKMISQGMLNVTVVGPREVFNPAVRLMSASVIIIHNHPSGDPQPSREDIDLTKRLVQAGFNIGIEVLDHVIIGDQKFLSFKEKGLM